MDNSLFNNFIKNALSYYDEQCDNIILLNYNSFKFDKTFVYFYDKIGKVIHDGYYEILGFIDLKKKIWQWSWVIPSISNEYTKLSKELLNYGLKLDNTDTSDHFFIRLLLLNSQIKINNSMEQEINIAIISYLIKNKIKFIFIDKFTDKNKITYYLIK